MTIPSNFKPIQIHNKVVHIEGQQKPVAIQIHEMTESLMVWVGSVLDGNQCVFGPLAVSMNSPYGSVPVGSTLIGVTTDNVSELIAKKLVMKFNKQIFVSWNLDFQERHQTSQVEQALFQFIQDITVS